MDIKKCDICEKEIKDRKCVYVRFDMFNFAEFCDDCALPVYKFLKKNKFVDKNNKAIKK